MKKFFILFLTFICLVQIFSARYVFRFGGELGEEWMSFTAPEVSGVYEYELDVGFYDTTIEFDWTMQLESTHTRADHQLYIPFSVRHSDTGVVLYNEPDSGWTGSSYGLNLTIHFTIDDGGGAAYISFTGEGNRSFGGFLFNDSIEQAVSGPIIISEQNILSSSIRYNSYVTIKQIKMRGEGELETRWQIAGEKIHDLSYNTLFDNQTWSAGYIETESVGPMEPPVQMIWQGNYSDMIVEYSIYPQIDVTFEVGYKLLSTTISTGWRDLDVVEGSYNADQTIDIYTDPCSWSTHARNWSLFQ